MGVLTPLKWHTYRAGRRVLRTSHSVWRGQRLDALERVDAPRAWEAVRADPRVETAVDLYRMGLCVARRGPVVRKYHARVELWVDRGK